MGFLLKRNREVVGKRDGMGWELPGGIVSKARWNVQGRSPVSARRRLQVCTSMRLEGVRAPKTNPEAWGKDLRW